MSEAERGRLTDEDAAILWEVLGPQSASLPVVAAVERLLASRDARLAAVEALARDAVAARDRAVRGRRAMPTDHHKARLAEAVLAALHSDPSEAKR